MFCFLIILLVNFFILNGFIVQCHVTIIRCKEEERYLSKGSVELLSFLCVSLLYVHNLYFIIVACAQRNVV